MTHGEQRGEADAGWFLIGAVSWVMLLGMATVEVKCKLTGNSFTFPGWWR